jgi:hypothetical protein
MIVKVQRPVGTQGKNSLPWLVYAEGKRHWQPRVTPTPRQRAQFGDALKRFYEADLINGQWRLIKPVEDQAW